MIQNDNLIVYFIPLEMCNHYRQNYTNYDLEGKYLAFRAKQSGSPIVCRSCRELFADFYFVNTGDSAQNIKSVLTIFGHLAIFDYVDNL